jgi:hypothetical protein
MSEAILSLEEFRSGRVSLPVIDADELPPCCFSCRYLYGKEFSIGEGATYLCCGYHLTVRTDEDASPNCLIE